LVTWLSLAAVGLGTAAVAVETQATPTSIRQSELDSAPRQQRSQEEFLIASYCANVTIPRRLALRVRSGPGTKYRAIGTVQHGQVVTVLKRNNAPTNSEASRWINIKYGSKSQGWVSSKYIGSGTSCTTVRGRA
jgi:uncharacterized protein YgiM (DUF1202 family)